MRIAALHAAGLLLAACGSGSGTPDGSPGTIDARAATTPDAPTPAALSVTPSTQDFGTVLQGSTASAIVQVMNPGGTAIPALTTLITGNDTAAFMILPGGCTGQALAPNTSCSISIRFGPTGAGTRRGTLVVKGPGGTPIATSDLEGTGILPGAIALAPTAPDLGVIAVGTKTKTTLTIHNSGDTTTGVLVLHLGGSNQSEFALLNDKCSGKTLAGGATCTFEAEFAPVMAGYKVASVSATAAPGGATAVSLVATAEATVAVTLEGSGLGTVTSSPEGILCASPDCGSSMHSFIEPTVTLIAEAAAGSTIGSWQGCDSMPNGSACVVRLNAATRAVTASFHGSPDAGVPDAAISEPDAAISEPDAAISEPDAAISEPDALSLDLRTRRPRP